MKFRPCIDIHDGKVKQIVGGSLSDEKSDYIKENFVSEVDAAFYAGLYKSKNIKGGHVIILNGKNTLGYKDSLDAALSALGAYPGGLQVGGGINPDNAGMFLDAGASHVIVTSFVFKDGCIDMDALNAMRDSVGRERLVLDLSCRKKEDDYFIVTDRWQKFTDVPLNTATLDMLSEYCDEYLIHAVDVEGKAAGIETNVAKMLGSWQKIPVTYAGGVHSYEDMRLVKELGRGHVDVTIGSALDIFGGNMKFEDVVAYC